MNLLWFPFPASVRASEQGITNRVGSNRAFIAPLAPIDQAICHPTARSPPPPPSLSSGERGTSSARKLNLQHCVGRSVSIEVAEHALPVRARVPPLSLLTSPFPLAYTCSAVCRRASAQSPISRWPCGRAGPRPQICKSKCG